MTMISGGSLQRVSVVTDPSGAVATASGQTCRTPGTLVLDRSQDHVVYASLDGYKPGQTIVDARHSPAKWLCSVLLNASHGLFTLGITFVIGMVIDIGMGSLQDLEPRTVFLPLQRWEEAPILPHEQEQLDPPSRHAPPCPPAAATK